MSKIRRAGALAASGLAVTSLGLVFLGSSAATAMPTSGAVAHTAGATAPRSKPQPRPTLSKAQATSLHAAIKAGKTAKASTKVVTLSFCAKHKLHCRAEVLAKSGSAQPVSSYTPFGLGAKDLESAYGVSGSSGVKGTITIIDAGAYPTVSSDLGVYRKQYGLPACTTANKCLTVKSYNGKGPQKPAKKELGKEVEEEVAVETALDLDMASAACPSCKLNLLQIPWRDAIAGSTKQVHTAQDHFATAVQTAKKMKSSSVSISYGYPTDSYAATGSPAKKMNVTGMAVSASTGDDGYNGLYPAWPQVLRSVIAVGGTELSEASDGTWNEAVWDYGGSGCSAGYTLPAYGQPSWIADLCNGYRAGADVAAVADPQTGVSVYVTYAPADQSPYEWIVVGGTSASSPLVAGLYARAGVPASTHGPNLLYAEPASKFRDIVAGANAPKGACSSDGVSERICNADKGWDGPTGLGAPTGLATFR